MICLQIGVVAATENKILSLEEVQQTFLTALNSFGMQLKELTEDMKAIEVITAAGTTTADISSSNSDLTNIANGKAQNVSAKLSILARTRLELDGDLLVILPIKRAAATSSSTGTDPHTNNNTTNVTTDVNENEPIVIDNEILNLHKENVNMALQNLQFVYGKVMDIASKFAESSGKNNIMGNFLRIK